MSEWLGRAARLVRGGFLFFFFLSLFPCVLFNFPLPPSWNFRQEGDLKLFEFCAIPHPSINLLFTSTSLLLLNL